MTAIKTPIKSLDVKIEAAAKASARQFLLSTGMYTAQGQIKPQYRS